jgi:fructokinase
MRKVIGIGETILDIIFKHEEPIAAVPGGSVFNGIISLGKLGMNVTFISETGNDHVGRKIISYMNENHVKSEHVNIFPDGKSPVSLAFLDEQNNADYAFYKDYPNNRLDVSFPDIQKDDIVMFGSYFALNPVIRDKVLEFLEYAKERKALFYYDPNFRSTHANEALKLTSSLIENLEFADIVRGSEDDFQYMYHKDDPDKIFKDDIQFYCPNFIYTTGPDKISLRTNTIRKEYDVPQIESVSTIAAGDNFNAGVVYGLVKYGITKESLKTMDQALWDKVIQCGMEFSADVCQSINNSVSNEFVTGHRL